MSFLTKVKNYPKIGLVILAFVAFIGLGMPDGLLGVAWPSIRSGFSVPLDALGMFLTALVIGYMTSSFFSGPIVTRLGVGKVLAISCGLTGIALFGYTFVPAWWMMVLLGVVAGFGAGAIDAGLNTYVAAHFSEGLMQWLHASWGVGITLGPIIMTLGLGATETWHTGYRIVGGFQLFLAACFVLTLPMWSDNGTPAAHDEPKKLTDYKTPMSETMRQPRVWMSALLFFLYVGAEGALGTWIYTLLTESRGIDPTLAGFWAGSYWATFTVGRIVAGLFANRIGTNKLVIGGLIGALTGALLLVWNPSAVVNLLAVAIIGFSIAPIFPAMMSGTSKRVGEHFAANTIGMQMTATGLGTAVIPGLMGVVAKQVSLETIPLILLGVYAGLLGVYLAVSTK
ncbi:MAG: MFS transporter [Anaerolineae bacterium]|nr:MFS transporter [Anaerolineae bacterium]